MPRKPSADAARSGEEFPAGLAQPALRALHGAGLTTLRQLTGVTEERLRELHGMGPNALGKLREALAAQGWSFSAPTPQAKPKRS